MQSNDAEFGAKLRRFQELEQGGNRRLQHCADHISAINEAVRYLKDTLESRNGRTDIALPKFPDRAAIVASFNEMLEFENEYRKLAGQLNLPVKGNIEYTIMG